MNHQMHADLMLGTRLGYSDLQSDERGQGAILLSGATGFLGAFLLQELLARRKNSAVICLVRAKDHEQAMLSIAMAMRSYDLDESRLSDINVIAADISHPCMGLPPNVFTELAATIDTVIHAAAHVNLLLPYRIMRQANVIGTYEMLRLCTIGLKKSFHYVSSVSVLGRSANRICPERFSISESNYPVSGYAQSKWVSEQLVVASAARGLQAAIYRPGLITGHSRTGVWHRRDALSLKLLACMHLRKVPLEKGEIGMTPIDYVSVAIEKLAAQPASAGNAFHLVNRRAVSWPDITGALIAGGYVDEIVSYPQWLALLRTQFCSNPGDVDLARAASLFSMIGPAAEEDSMPDIDDSNTREALRNLGNTPGPYDSAELLPRYFAWLSAQR